MYNDFIFYSQQYLDAHSYLIPLGVIGLWRWSVWLLKEIVALKYRPKKGKIKAKVSVITPVYNEDPQFFQKALLSWKKNKPYEIIAVIDATDKKCISIFKQFARFAKRAKKNKHYKLIITKVPGKRPALALGIKKAKGEIVALVDSDTIWDENLLTAGLPPFKDRAVAGVATYQNVLEPKTIAQRLFDTQLDLRYCDDFPFLAAGGDALVCLSGRTALYQRKVLMPLLPALVNETFFNKQVISGEDKRLTYLVLAEGWKVAYQSNAHVYTSGMLDMKSYFQQRLRWARNSLRADLRALKEGWPFKHPALIFFQIDKLLQAFVVILSPIYFLVSLWVGLWTASLVIFIWWFVSRGIKMYPHLKRRPKDIFLLPVFIGYSFLTAIIKIYAFFTLNTQGWITRWHKSRLPRFHFMQKAFAYAATTLLILFLGASVALYKQYTYFIPRENQKILIASELHPLNTLALANDTNVLGVTTSAQKDLSVKRYVTKPEDTLAGVAFANNISVENLLWANVSRITNWNNIESGLILSIPGKDISLTPSFNFNYQRIYADPLRIGYDEKTNTINIYGRGQKVTLSNIKASIGENYIKETSSKVWYLSATLLIHSGVTLTLNKDEVAWLKLASDRKTQAKMLAYNGVIDVHGVKITSWNQDANDYDKELSDGRSFIMVKDGSRLDLYGSELAYLGYPRTPDLTFSPYGVSWRMSNGKLNSTILSGEVINSKFHHNYFGAYTFGATGMVWRGNEFYDNIVYGLDPHDDSNGFLVEGNRSYNNGSHGIIFSKRCLYNVIRSNISYNNKLHGIMLHEKSNNNVIENNTLYGNTDGVTLWQSSSNIVRGNTIYKNSRGIRANYLSNDNLIETNTLTNNHDYGLYFYGNSNNNLIKNNVVTKSKDAIYIKSSDNTIADNKLNENEVGIYLIERASNNRLLHNQIAYNRSYGIYTKIKDGLSNKLGQNTLSRNRKDIFAHN